MPEMPEVETIARQLRRTIIGKRIVDVRLSGHTLRKPIDRTFPATLRGCTIRRITRRGKYLILTLEPKIFWVIHLGMSGHILYHTSVIGHSKHTHAVFRFSDETELEYRDYRRFGLLAAYEGIRLTRIPEVRLLGKDPLSSGFTPQWLQPLLQKSRQEIKSFLFNQRFIAGLGNIYIGESLFLAHIHPARRCFTLTPKEISHLVDAIRKVLRIAVKNKGTSFSDFIGSNGKRGGNQNFLKVYQREGENCVRCNAPIIRMRQGGRSSFYCAHCQK